MGIIDRKLCALKQRWVWWLCQKQILEILHGIDSDALLNSCLVEQKRLDNIENSNKQERIKAMSSLLNMEAFVDAREKLRKDQ